MAISTYQCTLNYKTSSSGSYTKLADIKDFPDMIGEPNNLETTTLSDGQQTFIPGIKQSEGVLQFTINWDKTVCATIQGLEEQDLYFELEFSDGSNFDWEGQLTLSVNGGGVDEVVEGTINIIPSTPITIVLS